MKKYIIISLALALTFMGCSREEENLFDKSASERIEDALKNANTVLTTAENGWDMVYFANSGMKGYHIVVDFRDNAQVSAAMKNDLSNNKLQTDTASLWEVIMDYGPILTFNTYNNILHLWADPQDDGVGYEGDYEFLILEANANNVRLKGKKYGAYSSLYPLETGITPEQYLDDIAAINARWFGNNNLLRFSNGTTQATLFDAVTGIMTEAPLDSVYEEDAPTHNFATLKTGIQFMDKWGDAESIVYKYNNGKLVCGDNVIEAGPLGKYFGNYIVLALNKWNLSLTQTNDSVAKLVGQLESIYRTQDSKATVDSLVIYYVPSLYVGEIGTYVVDYFYTLKGKVSKGGFVYDVTYDDNTISLAFKGEGYDKAGKNILNNALVKEPVKALLESLNGTYSLEVVEEPLNPSLGIKITQTEQNSLWFRLKGVM